MNLWLRDLTHTLEGSLRTFGAMNIFFFQLLARLPLVAATRIRLVIEQVHNAGTLSLLLIMVCGFFVGMVLGLQGYDSLSRFSSEGSLGAVAALSLSKELSPVLTALLFAGRAGTAITSEIGLMRATDQFSAMEMMAVDPVERVVLPKFIGGVVSVPLLTAIFNVLGLTGTYMVGVSFLGVDSGIFWSQLLSAVDFLDVAEGCLKSLVFGIAASLLAVFEGCSCTPTAEGVATATTRTVVTTAVSILAIDYVITSAFI